MLRPLLVLLLCLGCTPALAQQPTLPPVDSAVVELRLVDGTTLAGRIVAATDTSCTIVTPAGVTVVVPRRTLASWRGPESRSGSSRFGRPDPGRTRLFLAPTARTLARGEGYVGDYWVLFPVVGYGVTDRISVAGGMSAIPGLTLGQQLLYLAPKVSLVRSPTFGLGAGALYMRLAWHDIVDAWGGVAYGVATFGGEDAALTVGFGWPFASGGGTRDPWVMAGAEQRVSRGLKLLVEGWKFPGSGDVPVVVGVRFVDVKVAVDLGVVRVLGEDQTGILPWVDFSVKW